MSSLRARATIIFLRRRGVFSVRARNHLARALSFWKLRKRHASWTIPRRTRALPDRARPFSRRLLPLLLTAATSSSKTNGLKMDIASVGIGWFARGDQACRRARRRKGSAFRRASERHALGAGRP